MEFGVSTACFYGTEDVEDTFDILRAQGVKLTEVFLNTFSEYDEKFVRRLARIKGDIRVHSVHAHGTCFEPELYADYYRVSDDAERIFRSVCAAGQILGAKFYTFHGPFVKKGRPPKINMEKFAERTNRLCEIAAEYDIKVAYENVNWAYFTDTEFFDFLKSRCPLLAATLDVKQALYCDLDVYKLLECMGDRLATVHICDLVDGERPTMPFRGNFDFEKLLARLSETNPSVSVLLEVYSSCYRDYDDLGDVYRRLISVAERGKK